ncbi:PTS transporter subunit IIC [Lacticaseibacillus parahuelsenbergensis]|uniref:PTS transporter subunit IIC n=1 Tax=Lacticaseibacillus parahuelsenbergensis TaxID=3068305 RepID=A0ABY9L3V3_9LACO|nr:PTS transporter subunit IIC [Lacticaseibacillus sp. NCIMB 15471]WLV78416.1 PTS transporter subunit IIC [Lacticaseibacillus sp. NCIMB 15471]
MQFIQAIVNLGAAAMMPIIFFVVGMMFRLSVGKAFKAGMLVGIGFTGVNMVINLLLANLGPASKAMVERIGLKLTVVDTGWPTASTIGWGSPIMPVLVIGFLAVNALMLVTNLTKTVDIDIFNYWLFLLVGAVSYAASGSFWFAIIGTLIIFAVTLVVADLTAPWIQRQYNLKGISFPHLTCLAWVPFGIAANWIVDKIPGLNKIKMDPETIQKKFGVFGEPLTLGFILGIAIGLMAGYSPTKIIALAINVAASMYLLPKMIDVLIEGLVIVRDQVEGQLKKWFPKRKFYIGMDTALLIGEPSVLATGLILIPIAIVLAFILPGNKVLPFVDLASLMFLLALITPFVKRNMFRMMIAGALVLICIFYVGTDIAPFYTKAAIESKIAVPKGISSMTNIVGTATTWIGWGFIKISQFFGAIF